LIGQQKTRFPGEETGLLISLDFFRQLNGAMGLEILK
jgi:hypothetical protein